MNILLLDTSGPVCGTAVVRDGELIGEINGLSGRRHSVQTMPIVDSLLSFLGLSLPEIDVFGAVVGPGSFTGIRIGIATAAALAEAEGKKCFPIAATQALAAGVGGFEGIVCPLIDARKPRIYTALFRAGFPPKRAAPDRQTTIDELLTELQEQGERVLFTGDAAEVHAESIKAALSGRGEIAPCPLRSLRAGTACALAFEEIARGAFTVDPANLRAVYLQPSQAEREESERANP